jgi:signal transduction histidine kinase
MAVPRTTEAAPFGSAAPRGIHSTAWTNRCCWPWTTTLRCCGPSNATCDRGTRAPTGSWPPHRGALAAALARLEALAPPPARPQPPGGEPPQTALERSERTAELAELVGDEAAGALARSGWTPDAVRALPPTTAEWLAAHTQVHDLVADLGLAIQRISEIVGAVKGYTFLDQAPVQRVDVRKGIEETLTILRHRLRGGVTVERDYADDCPLVEAYGSELNQVWTNLIDNAIDAMEEKGLLLLRVVRDPDSGGACVSICDTGPGIPAPVRDRLFEPFFTTKPPGKGTGLGLHISHAVVARHGGRIDVASAPGRTCFVVTLPVALPASG